MLILQHFTIFATRTLKKGKYGKHIQKKFGDGSGFNTAVL